MSRDEDVLKRYLGPPVYSDCVEQWVPNNGNFPKNLMLREREKSTRQRENLSSFHKEISEFNNLLELLRGQDGRPDNETMMGQWRVGPHLTRTA